VIVLDTNVISVLMRPETAPKVLDWVDSQPIESIWTTSVTVFEVRYGLAVLPEGKRRSALETIFERLLLEGLGNRVLDFDADSALVAADLMAQRKSRGLGMDMRDLLIAGVVSSRRTALATRNTNHFQHAGIDLVNPWEQG